FCPADLAWARWFLRSPAARRSRYWRRFLFLHTDRRVVFTSAKKSALARYSISWNGVGRAGVRGIPDHPSRFPLARSFPWFDSTGRHCRSLALREMGCSFSGRCVVSRQHLLRRASRDVWAGGQRGSSGADQFDQSRSAHPCRAVCRPDPNLGAPSRPIRHYWHDSNDENLAYPAGPSRNWVYGDPAVVPRNAVPDVL